MYDCQLFCRIRSRFKKILTRITDRGIMRCCPLQSQSFLQNYHLNSWSGSPQTVMSHVLRFEPPHLTPWGVCRSFDLFLQYLLSVTVCTVEYCVQCTVQWIVCVTMFSESTLCLPVFIVYILEEHSVVLLYCPGGYVRSETPPPSPCSQVSLPPALEKMTAQLTLFHVLFSSPVACTAHS